MIKYPESNAKSLISQLFNFHESVRKQDFKEILRLLQSYEKQEISKDGLLNKLIEFQESPLQYTVNAASSIKTMLLQSDRNNLNFDEGFAVSQDNVVSFNPAFISSAIGAQKVYPLRVTFSVALCTSAPTIKEMHRLFANSNIICLDVKTCNQNNPWKAPRDVGKCINAALEISKGNKENLTLTGKARDSYDHCIDQLENNKGIENLGLDGDILKIIYQEICGQHLLASDSISN